MPLPPTLTNKGAGTASAIQGSSSDASSKSKSHPERTRRALFETVEVASKGCSPDRLGEILVEKFDTLRLVLDSYKSPNPASRKAIETNQHKFDLQPGEKEFVFRISSLLDLDEVQSFHMLRSCLRNEIQSPISHIRYGAVRLTYDDQLLDAVANHYLEEREATLLLFGALLRASDDESHAYYQQAAQFVSDLLGEGATTDEEGLVVDSLGNAFIDRIIDQFKRLLTKRIPPQIEPHPKRAVRWARQYLQEQKGLLEILFLTYYDRVQCTPSRAISLMEMFVESRFALSQANESLFGADVQRLWTEVSHLCVLVALEVMNLEAAADHHAELSDEPTGSSFLDAPEEVVKMTNVLGRIVTDRRPPSGGERDVDAHGPVLLGWGSLLQRITGFLENAVGADGIPCAYQNLAAMLNIGTPQGAAVPQILVQRAYGSNALSYIYRSLTQFSCYTDDDNNALGYRSVIKGLMTLFMVCFPINKLPQYELFVECTIALYNNTPELCIQFWEQDYPIEERRSLLETTRNRFPLQFSPFVRLLKALIGNKQTAIYVFRYLKSMSTFTDLYDESEFVREGAGDNRGSGSPVYVGRYRWKGRRGLVRGASQNLNLAAPAGAPGLFLSANPPVIMLNFQYSVWHLLVSLVDSFLQNVDGGAAGAGFSGVPTDNGVSAGLALGSESRLTGTKENVTDILNLIMMILSHADSELFDAFIAHLRNFPSPGTGSGSGSKHVLTPTDIVNLVCRVLNRCTSLPDPPTDLLTSCLRTLSIFLRRYPRLVWTHLRHESLMPRYSSAAGGVGGILGRDGGTYQVNSYMQQILLPRERSTGMYKTTLAFLDLLLQLVYDAQRYSDGSTDRKYGDNHSADFSRDENDTPFMEDAVAAEENLMRVKAEVLSSCIVFIHSEIFPTYNGWRYVYILERFQIGLKVLKIFNAIMRDTTHLNRREREKFQTEGEAGRKGRFAGVTKDLGFPQEYLSRSFLEDGTLYQIVPLLDIIGAGNDLPESLYRRRKMREARALERSIAQGMLFLKHLLARRKVAASGKVSLLEHALLDRTVRVRGGVTGSGGGVGPILVVSGSGNAPGAMTGVTSTSATSSAKGEPMELVHIMGRYINYDYNIDIPLLATQVLTLLCSVAADWESRPPSFVGYFGDEARAIVASFVELAKDDSVTATSDVGTAEGGVDIGVGGHAKETLQAAIFAFVTAVVETQPGLAMMFIAGDRNGSQLGPTVVSSSSASGGNSRTTSNTLAAGSSQPKSEKDDHLSEHSILSAALQFVKGWKTYLTAKPSVLPAAMRLLDVLWQHWPEYQHILNGLRMRDDFWAGLASLCSIVEDGVQDDQNAVKQVDWFEFVVEDEDYGGGGNGSLAVGYGGAFRRGNVAFKSKEENTLRKTCFRHLMRAHALRILALEIYYCMSSGRNGKEKTGNDRQQQGAQGMLHPRAVAFLNEILEDVVTRFEKDSVLSFDDEITRNVAEAASGQQQGSRIRVQVAQDGLSPPCELNDFRVLTLGESLNTTGNGAYGDSYVYDVELLASKYGFGTPSHDDANGNGGGVSHSTAASEADSRDTSNILSGMEFDESSVVASDIVDMAQDDDSGSKGSLVDFLARVCAVNHNWALTDAQMTLFRSWKFFLELLSSRIGMVLWPQYNNRSGGLFGGAASATSATVKPTGGPSSKLYDLIILLGEKVADEGRQGFVIVEYLSDISSMFLFLLKQWMKSATGASDVASKSIASSSSSSLRKTNELEDRPGKLRRVVQLLKDVHGCIRNDSYPYLDAYGNFSSVAFHNTFFAALLLVLRSLHRLLESIKDGAGGGGAGSSGGEEQTMDKELRQSFAEEYLTIFPVVCSALASVLKRGISASSTGLDARSTKGGREIGGGSRSAFGMGGSGGLVGSPSSAIADDGWNGHMKVLLAVMNQMVSKLPPSVGMVQPAMWLPIVEKHDIIPLLLDMYSKCVAVPISMTTTTSTAMWIDTGMGGVEMMEDNTGGWGLPSPHTEDVLRLLESFASIPQGAERLAVHGLLATFSNSSFSPLLVEGVVGAYVGSERNNWHRIWVWMLSILSTALQHLKDSPMYIQGVMSFVGLYWRQISRAFDVSAEPPLTAGNLQEIECLSELFYRLARYLHGWNNAPELMEPGRTDGFNTPAMMFAYQDSGLQLLRYYVDLFAHPQQLSARILAVSRDEKEAAAVTVPANDNAGDGATTAGQQQPSTLQQKPASTNSGINSRPLSAEVEDRMLLVVRNLLHFLLISTDTISVLSTRSTFHSNSNMVGYRPGNLLFTPSMVIFSGPGAETSIGTLFDLLVNVLERIQTVVVASTSSTTNDSDAPQVGGLRRTSNPTSFFTNPQDGSGQSSSSSLDGDRGNAAAALASSLDSLSGSMAWSPDTMLGTVEGCLTLIVTQLASFLQSPDVDVLIKREVQSELGNELATYMSLVKQRLNGISNMDQKDSTKGPSPPIMSKGMAVRWVQRANETEKWLSVLETFAREHLMPTL
ncbi:hypothetical protein HK102_014055 [Quaeritorhiza haematococci]|nr:hypothetical protein HK102_014055 [Quaeritorhiza haematococci]